MNGFVRASALSALAFLAACSNLQVVGLAEVPQELAHPIFRFSEDRPGRDLVAPRSYEVPERSMFLQQSSGGSLAVGLLFGPLGVLANVANIDRITRETGESGRGSSLYSIDALQEARSAWNAPSAATETAGSPTEISLKPFILLYVASEKAGITTIASVRVETNLSLDGDPSKKWVGLYSFVLHEMLPYGALQEPLSTDDRAKYRASLAAAFTEIRAEMQRDLSGAAAPKRQIAWVKSPILFGGIGLPGDIEQSADGRLSLRITTRNAGPLAKPLFTYGVYLFPSKDQYTFGNGPVERR